MKIGGSMTEGGESKTGVRSTFPAVDTEEATGRGAARAHAVMESNQQNGKIELTWGEA